jgi:hypothetical protein
MKTWRTPRTKVRGFFFALRLRSDPFKTSDLSTRTAFAFCIEDMCNGYLRIPSENHKTTYDIVSSALTTHTGNYSGCHWKGRFSRGAVSHISLRKVVSKRFQVVSNQVPMVFQVSRDRQEKSELNKSKKKQTVRPGGSKKSWCRN